MFGRMDWFKRAYRAAKAANDAYGFATSDLAKLALWPLAGAAVTALSGFASAVPLPYILAAASVAFAAIATGLLRLDEWRERTDASGKLLFERPVVRAELAEGGGAPKLAAVRYELLFRNAAGFPIHYEVEPVRSDFMGRINPEKSYLGKASEVPARATFWFRDAQIPVDAPPPDGWGRGRVQFTVTYWRTPKRKFTMRHGIKVGARIDLDARQVETDWVFE